MLTNTHRAASHGLPSQLLGLAAWLALTFAAAAAGAIASLDAAGFYGQLELPAWAPPASLFGPVWTVLYLMMGVAAWLVWRDHGWRDARAALAVYVVQLALNALWTWLFFAWQQGALAFAEILLLWGAIALNTLLFARLHTVAGLLLLPYLAWVSFATVLTYALWQLNPDRLA